MTTGTTLNVVDSEQMPLGQFARKAYLDYSMYVIMDRALPFLGDGLKPVQRRIIYAMSELGLKATAKHKKSARTVGDVLGKYHPHGDSACYEAMVLMAQPFTYRYPLVDGQGNWGAVDDPKSFAAMRYTEARLSAYADALLAELGMGTVTWGANFDGSLEEPVSLPAQLPNLLLNGTTGIAVGMATDIPPHNLKEIVAACVHLLDHPTATVEDLCEFVQGPDYPTGAEIITPKDEILEMYRQGHGSIRMRATFEYENGDIVVTALPYQVSPAKVQEQIADQMRSKKLPMVSDLRDESDHDEPVRLVIIPRSNRVDKEALMAHLFATTDMEKTYRVNQNVIGLDRKPRVMGLLPMLTEWLDFRTQTVRMRLTHRLEKVLQRLHILEGYLIAFLNIDEVIHIIRHEDDPKAALMSRFGLTDAQTEAILQLRLRHLAKLEEMKITGERDELENERQQLESVLGSDKRLKKLIEKELKAAAKKFGDARRTPIVARKQAQAISQVDLAPTEILTVVLSRNGWVRAGKGVDIDPQGLSYKAGDQYLSASTVKSNQMAVFMDTAGRTYSILSFSLPSARGQGEPLTRHFAPPTGARFINAMGGDPEQQLLVASDAGYGFVTRLKHLYSKNQKGKAFITLPKESLPLEPLYVDRISGNYLVVITTTGRLLVFPLTQLPELPRGKGNKLINIPSKLLKDRQEVVRYLAILTEGGTLVLHSGKRSFTLNWTNLAGFIGERARRGRLLPRGFRNVSDIETVAPETESEISDPDQNDT